MEILANNPKDAVWVLTHGQTGLKKKPSKQELFDFLDGSENYDDAVCFILKNGKLMNPTQNGDIKKRDRSEYHKAGR